MRGSRLYCGRTEIVSVSVLRSRRGAELPGPEISGFTVRDAQWEEQGANTAGVREFTPVWANGATHTRTFFFFLLENVVVSLLWLCQVGEEQL